MIYPICAIEDRKGDFFSPKVFTNTDVAVRDFAQIVNTPEGVINFAPSDFSLYHLGDFDSDNGFLFPLDKPKFLVNGNDLKGVVSRAE